MAYKRRLCSGLNLYVIVDKTLLLWVFKATRVDYIFLPSVPFILGLHFLGERQAGHEEKKQAAATSKPLKGS